MRPEKVVVREAGERVRNSQLAALAAGGKRAFCSDAKGVGTTIAAS
jgi:hypothetical protein